MSLGISSPALKTACRRLGIPRWPRRPRDRARVLPRPAQPATAEQRGGVGPEAPRVSIAAAADAELRQPSAGRPTAAQSACADEAAAPDVRQSRRVREQRTAVAASSTPVGAALADPAPVDESLLAGASGGPAQLQLARSHGSWEQDSDTAATQRASAACTANNSQWVSGEQQSSAGRDTVAVSQHAQKPQDAPRSVEPQSGQPSPADRVAAVASEAQHRVCAAVTAAHDGSDTEADATQSLRTISRAEPAREAPVPEATHVEPSDNVLPLQQQQQHASVALQQASPERPVASDSPSLQHGRAPVSTVADRTSAEAEPGARRPTQTARLAEPTVGELTAQPLAHPSSHAALQSPPSVTAGGGCGSMAQMPVHIGNGLRSVATLVAAAAADEDACAAQEWTPVNAAPQQPQTAGVEQAVSAPSMPCGSPRVSPDARDVDLLQSPAAKLCLDADDIDIGVDGRDTACRDKTEAAAALLAGSALRKVARQMLAEGAGCSRAVPEHAVTLNAALRGLNAAAPIGGSEVGGAIGRVVASKRRITAACWRCHADERGCARAVSRTDVASLAGMLSPAGWVAEPLQASLIQTCLT